MDDLITWKDLANRYDLVLFNNIPKLSDGKVLQEWSEDHTCKPERNEDKDDYQCECEPCQWYAISIDDLDIKMLKKKFDIEIFYSEYLGINILPVYHFGTSWNIMKLGGGYANIN